MKKELIKIAFISVGIYMMACGLFSGIGMISSVGHSASTVNVEKEKYVFKAPAYRALESDNELTLDTSKYENNRVVYAFAGNN